MTGPRDLGFARARIAAGLIACPALTWGHRRDGLCRHLPRSWFN